MDQNKCFMDGVTHVEVIFPYLGGCLREETTLIFGGKGEAQVIISLSLRS